MNIDLPAYFLHRPWKQDWLFIKGPTSKYYHEEFYNKMEELAESGKSQSNIISWFGFLERACSDPSGKYRYVRVAPRYSDGSNEYPQSLFLRRNKKNNVYPCKPQFYYTKVGFKGVNII